MTTILLSSVFGPYGVDDAYGRKENIMELFHNQVTREQGIFSLRINHPSFGLHLLAENIEAGAKVLDFPSQKRFIKEIKKNYDYVGISFITPNFLKAKRMAELVRKHAPNSKIILGGHGTRIPEIREQIDCDHVCTGEGVYWLRELFGEKVDRPINHPKMGASVSHRIMGVPRPAESAVLIPGVGCPNACRFCATSHFFDRKYTPYLHTGDEIFALCQEIEAHTGLTEFFVMDENFLKYRERAERLLELMERAGKQYRFGIFSSAETIQSVGVPFMARLGVHFLWMGIEGKEEIYEKNKDVDFVALIETLRDAGISVLASGILFSEHHTKDSIEEEIDYMVSLNADFVQFMELGPLPRTALYDAHRKNGSLREDIPYEEWHGQHKIWFDHDHFERDQTPAILKGAFERDFQVNGPSLFRLFETVVRGARNAANFPQAYDARRQQLVRQCKDYRPILRWFKRFAPTPSMRQQAVELDRQYTELLGPESWLDRTKSFAIWPLVMKLALADKAGRTVFQPPTLETRYRLRESGLSWRNIATFSFAGVRQVSPATTG